MPKLAEFLPKAHPLLSLAPTVAREMDPTRRPLYLRTTPQFESRPGETEPTTRLFQYLGDTREQVRTALTKMDLTPEEVEALCNRTPIVKTVGGINNDLRIMIVRNHDPNRPVFTEPIRRPPILLLATKPKQVPHAPQRKASLVALPPPDLKKSPKDDRPSDRPKQALPIWATRIREAREARGIPQKGLSKTLGFRYNIIYYLEIGMAPRPTEKMFLDLARELQVEPRELKEEGPPPEPPPPPPIVAPPPFHPPPSLRTDPMPPPPSRHLYLRETPIVPGEATRTFRYVGVTPEEILATLSQLGYPPTDVNALCNRAKLVRDGDGGRHELCLVLVPDHDPERLVFTTSVRNLLPSIPPKPSDPPKVTEPLTPKPTEPFMPRNSDTKAPTPSAAAPKKPIPVWATRLADARQQAGLTQTELSEKLGKKYNSVSVMERGYAKEPTREQWVILAEALNKPVAWLKGKGPSAQKANGSSEPPESATPLPPPSASQGPMLHGVGPIRAHESRKNHTQDTKPTGDSGRSPVKEALIQEITTTILNPKVTDAQTEKIGAFFRGLVVSVLLN